jgi:putative endonuclease
LIQPELSMSNQNPERTMNQEDSQESNWHVYMILCSDDSLYTGITTDVERRMRQHATGRGAKYFRGRQVKELVYVEGGHDRSSASRREMSIKSLKRAEKEQLLVSALNEAAAVAAVP